MTCRENWELDHPGEDFEDNGHDKCPWHWGYLSPPDYCGDLKSNVCEECWNREIPEEKVTNTDFEHPCRNCNVGWGSVSTTGVNSCHDTCERLAEYSRQRNNKGETMNETNNMLCTTCIHLAVCKNTEEFRIAQLAIASMKIDLGGDNNIVRLCDISYVKPVELQCKYFRKEVNIR